MKKKLILFIGLILSSYAFSSELTQCNMYSALGEELDERIKAAREKYSSLCLTCEGSSCRMNVFKSESDSALEEKRKTVVASCKRIFCTPTKFRKIQGEEIPTDLPIGKTMFEFSYKISEKGRIRDVKIISIEGAMNNREAYRWATTMTKRVIYLPLELNGKSYTLTDLAHVQAVDTGVFDAN